MVYSKWYRKHSFDQNEEYTEKILLAYGLNEYNFVMDGYGSYALHLTYGGNTYRIEINDIEEKMYVKKKIMKHGTPLWRGLNSFHNDCILNSLKEVKKDNKMLDKTSEKVYNNTYKGGLEV